MNIHDVRCKWQAGGIFDTGAEAAIFHVRSLNTFPENVKFMRLIQHIM
jgi:hypothetical protein